MLGQRAPGAEPGAEADELADAMAQLTAAARNETDAPEAQARRTMLYHSALGQLKALQGSPDADTRYAAVRPALAPALGMAVRDATAAASDGELRSHAIKYVGFTMYEPALLQAYSAAGVSSAFQRLVAAGRAAIETGDKELATLILWLFGTQNATCTLSKHAQLRARDAAAAAQTAAAALAAMGPESSAVAFESLAALEKLQTQHPTAAAAAARAWFAPVVAAALHARSDAVHSRAVRLWTHSLATPAVAAALRQAAAHWTRSGPAPRPLARWLERLKSQFAPYATLSMRIDAWRLMVETLGGSVPLGSAAFSELAAAAEVFFEGRRVHVLERACHAWASLAVSAAWNFAAATPAAASALCGPLLKAVASPSPAVFSAAANTWLGVVALLVHGPGAVAAAHAVLFPMLDVLLGASRPHMRELGLQLADALVHLGRTGPAFTRNSPQPIADLLRAARASEPCATTLSVALLAEVQPALRALPDARGDSRAILAPRLLRTLVAFSAHDAKTAFSLVDALFCHTAALCRREIRLRAAAAAWLAPMLDEIAASPSHIIPKLVEAALLAWGTPELDILGAARLSAGARGTTLKSEACSGNARLYACLAVADSTGAKLADRIVRGDAVAADLEAVAALAGHPAAVTQLLDALAARTPESDAPLTSVAALIAAAAPSEDAAMNRAVQRWLDSTAQGPRRDAALAALESAAPGIATTLGSLGEDACVTPPPVPNPPVTQTLPETPLANTRKRLARDSGFFSPQMGSPPASILRRAHASGEGKRRKTVTFVQPPPPMGILARLVADLSAAVTDTAVAACTPDERLAAADHLVALVERLRGTK